MNCNNIFGRLININNKIITVIIKVKYFVKIYNKYFYHYKKIKAMDIYKESNLGDFVLLKKTRLLKKSVSWLLIKTLEKVKLL